MEKPTGYDSRPENHNPYSRSLVRSVPESSFISSVVNFLPNLIQQILSFIFGFVDALNPWRYTASAFVIPKARMTMILEFPVMDGN